MSNGKEARFEVRVSSSWLLEVETEFHRLHQTLLTLKRTGQVAKSRALKETQVRRLIIRLGLDVFRNLSYEEFEKLCSEKNI